MRVLALELAATRAARGETQTHVAEYVLDWLANNDLPTALDAIEASTPPGDLDETRAVLALIRHHLVKHPGLVAASSASQASVSKWVWGRADPTPDKWVPIAQYLDFSLVEFYRAMTQNIEPLSKVALKAQVAGLRDELDATREVLDAYQDDLATAERALRLVDREHDHEIGRLETALANVEADRDALAGRVAELERRTALVPVAANGA